MASPLLHYTMRFPLFDCCLTWDQYTFACPIDVQVDDQILLLVTCTEKDQDRRVIAARRVRNGENEATLKKTVERSRKR